MSNPLRQDLFDRALDLNLWDMWRALPRGERKALWRAWRGKNRDRAWKDSDIANAWVEQRAQELEALIESREA